MKKEPRVIKIEQYLEEFKEPLPAGLIRKTATGIGATTKEIKEDRNSIIVCPTRYLAGTKAISNDIYYMGSAFPGIEPVTPEQIIKDLNGGKQVKVMAVADTFVNSYEKLKEYLDQFFVMIDEIDSFQSESHYRGSLEDCREIYFKKLQKDKRAMISATMNYSMDDEMKNEYSTLIEVESQKKEPLVVRFVTKDMIKTAKLAISEYLKNKQPDEKIIVAYNSIKGIKKIIHIIKGELTNSIGVLCSDNNIDKIPKEHQTNLVNGKLEKEVTFMTSAFFVGVDIYEKAWVIVIADDEYSFTLLSVEKIFQIFGRVRIPAVRRLFLFNKSHRYGELEIGSLMKYIKQKILIIQSNVDNEKIKYQETKNIKELHDDLDKIVESSKIYQIPLVRRKGENLMINRLNVDYILIQRNAINEIYKDIERANRELGKYFEVSDIKEGAHDLTSEERQRIDDSEGNLTMDKIAKTLGLINNYFRYQITQDGPKHPDNFQKEIESTLRWIFSEKKPIEEKLKEKVKKDLQDFTNNGYQAKKIVAYRIQLKAQLLNKRTKPFWKEMNKVFKIGKSYTSSEIHTGMKNLIPTIQKELGEDLSNKINEQQSSSLLQCFFITKRHRKKDVTDRKRGKQNEKVVYKRELLGYCGEDLLKNGLKSNGGTDQSSEETPVQP